MIGRIFRPLDRYVFGEFWRTFVVMALGFPVLVIVIDLTDNIDKYLNRNLPRSQIALSYLYWLPDSMFMVLPAAVLFATVFSVGGFTRHSEITAAKASGISFWRLTTPIFVGSVIAAILGLFLGELVPKTNARREELLQERQFSRGTDRFNFAYAAEEGRVYKVSAINATTGAMDGVEIERKGNGPDYPTYVLSVSNGRWVAAAAARARARSDSAPALREPLPPAPPAATNAIWLFGKGMMHIIPDSGPNIAIAFDSLHDRGFTERPVDLLATPKAPTEMGWRELGRFIRAMERSGADVNELRVERMLKLSIPITCIIIALFGAPLATSTQRGGTAYGVGVSLGTTVVFLMLIQLTKAIGGKGLVPPDFAAWLPNIIFGVVGLYLLSRVRT
jgi:lipopolysaccharide export system permease protein